MRSQFNRLRREAGFTMIHVMMVMTAVMSISIAAIAASNSDIRMGVYDRESKQAYAAAEAGIAEYMTLLNRDNAYWRKCADRAQGVPTYISQRWNNAGTDPRTFRNMPGARAGKGIQYTIELLPANGESSCDVLRANETMLDTKTGAFQIRVTGRVQRNGGPVEAKRSLVATFKRTSFLEFLYFTDYETSDPFVYGINTWGRATRPATPNADPNANSPDVVAWSTDECSRYRREGRGDRVWIDSDSDGSLDDGRIFWPNGSSDSSPWKFWSSRCSEIQFTSGDQINGPMHTNDELLTCGTPAFGRPGKNDSISVTSGTAYRSCGGGSTPTFNGTVKANQRKLPLPPDNKALEKVADPAYTFSGRTTIVLGSSTITVNGVSRQYPANGVIYVKDNGTCGYTYNPLYPNSAPAACGDALVSGTYGRDLTIGASNDIVITGDVRRPTPNPPDVTLGLIAKSFVRVGHMTSGPNLNESYPPDRTYPTCTNQIAGTNTQSRTIEAAILALQHSFIVDNYYCGAPLGTLTVFGVIAQKYRGPVGTGNGVTASTGYLKNYNYDDRLSLRQPPHFLDPVQSAWRLRRQSEQTGVR